jgi:mRNA-degrading endonuclease RelE of RelBE toxin-antitoxin system
VRINSAPKCDPPISTAHSGEHSRLQLAEEPRPAGVKALQGLPGLLRLRVGAYRVLYQVHDDQLLVLVLTLGHRRDVYRQR